MNLIQHNLFRLLLLGIIIGLIISFQFIRYKAQHGYNLKESKTLCDISMAESDQFICESDEQWQSRRKFYLKQHEKNILTMNEYESYFRENWFPDFQCEHETRIGVGDGGKWACDIEYLKTKSSCLIYSMGSQGDFSFEESVHKLLPHCSIHTVDMKYYACPIGICTFHLAELGDGRNGTKTLRQLMTELNQTNSQIDIFKIDIEYGEYTLFHLLFSNNAINRKLQPVYIRQILIEVHLDRSRILETNALFHLFNSQNYAIYHKEINPGFPFYACEYGLLKLNRTFFRGHFK